MQNLYQKLKKYTLADVIKIEEYDRQFIAIKELYKNIGNKDLFLLLIISNSIICYQLSGK
ncbi:MAG: N-glycosylase/DNA lyase [Patescibacteria group bacterium]|nr:N-glycosylase/DNA lyase [Patescibacteria group bacterium]